MNFYPRITENVAYFFVLAQTPHYELWENFFQTILEFSLILICFLRLLKITTMNVHTTI